MTTRKDIFGARAALQGTGVTYYQLDVLTRHGVQGLDRLPFTIKIILENVLRQAGGDLVTEDDVLSLARWVPGQASKSDAEYPFLPARVLLQDFTGVPAVADLAVRLSDKLAPAGSWPWTLLREAGFANVRRWSDAAGDYFVFYAA